MDEDRIAALAKNVAQLYLAIKAENDGIAPAGNVDAITRVEDVKDRLSGLLFAVHEIGVTLEAVGGQKLVHQVTVAVEDRLDDVLAHVFLSRRWDGHPRR